MNEDERINIARELMNELRQAIPSERLAELGLFLTMGLMEARAKGFAEVTIGDGTCEDDTEVHYQLTIVKQRKDGEDDE